MGPPKQILPYVTEFCRSISEADPVYLRVAPESEGIALDCFANVRRRQERDGGDAVLGWRIWEWSGVMIEAELHAVWHSPDGELHDVTPAPPSIDGVLFLPDANVQYDGRQINNIRKALSSDSRIGEFIAAAQGIYEIMNRGERAHQHGEIHLDGDEAREYQVLQRRKMLLQLQIEGTPPKRNEMCRCGSGKKSKRCCYG
jgi:hypothetical protein